jgi:hypothetical protein
MYNPSSFITLSLLDGENQELEFREPLQNRVINSDKTLAASIVGGKAVKNCAAMVAGNHFFIYSMGSIRSLSDFCQIIVVPFTYFHE